MIRSRSSEFSQHPGLFMKAIIVLLLPQAEIRNRNLSFASAKIPDHIFMLTLKYTMFEYKLELKCIFRWQLVCFHLFLT